MTSDQSDRGQPTEGRDPSGAVSVTLDPAFRVIDVRISERPESRDPDELSRAFSTAYAVAMNTHIERARGDEPPPASGARPVALAPVLTLRPPTAADLERHSIREESFTTTRRGNPGEVTGVSRNDCVHVTLPPAQPRGTITTDPGWLAHAQTANIASALVEAFADAYRQRDNA